MTALNKDQILDAVAGMSVLDLSELIKAMETKFGVSAAAAAVAVAVYSFGGWGSSSRHVARSYRGHRRNGH